MARPVALQLGHAGRRGACRPRSVGVDVPLENGWGLVSASPLPYGPYSAVPRELGTEEMPGIREDFVAAARRAAELDVDVLELDFAHGYLLASFLSPLTNQRTDAYGEDRLRFPLELLDAVRGAWDGVLAVRLSVTDWARGGVSVEDGVAIARALVEHGCDLVHTVAGQTVVEGRPEYRRGFLTALSDRVRAGAQVPTLVGGHLTTLDDVNTIVGAGRGDLCIVDLPPSDLESELPPAPKLEQSAIAPVMTEFAQLAYPDAEELLAGPRKPVLLLPLGATEPHGPHGPLETDTLISLGVCRRAAERLADDPDVRALVLPPLPYGVTRYGAAFPGAVSIARGDAPLTHRRDRGGHSPRRASRGSCS